MSKNDSTQAALASFNYQDDVNVGLDHNEDIEADPEEEDDLSGAVSIDPAEKIQMAIHKASNEKNLLILFLY